MFADGGALCFCCAGEFEDSLLAITTRSLSEAMFRNVCICVFCVFQCASFQKIKLFLHASDTYKRTILRTAASGNNRDTQKKNGGNINRLFFSGSSVSISSLRFL